MQGIVIKNTGSQYQVRIADRSVVDCKIKGSFRIKGIKSTNPVAVGDRVVFDVLGEGEGLISSIEERKNYIVRKPTNLSKQMHIIAANVDQALLIATINYPETSTTFIDRFLATCEAYRVPAKLIVNKLDCYSNKELKQLDAFHRLYERIGYECLSVSSLKGQGLEPVKELLSGKISLLSGNSGVGKSSLINAIAPELSLQTGEISTIHNKGMHTTTFSEMFEIGKNTFVIDTPGIKGFGTIDFHEDEVGHFFPEIFRVSQDCKFNNCTHTHEPDCAVLKAMKKREIAPSRYQSYLNIKEDCHSGKYRPAH